MRKTENQKKDPKKVWIKNSMIGASIAIVAGIIGYVSGKNKILRTIGKCAYDICKSYVESDSIICESETILIEEQVHQATLFQQ